MPQIQFEKKQLDKMLADVASSLDEMLKGEQEALLKTASEDAPAEESEGSSGPSAPPAEDEGSTPPAPEASGPPAESAPPTESAPPSPAEASAAPEGTPQHEAGEIEPAPTVEALQAEYSKLDPETLKRHYLAAKSALMAVMGAEQSAPAPGPEASAPPAPPAPAPDASAPPMMGKAELEKVASNPVVAARMAANKAKAKTAPAPAPAPAPAQKAEGKEFPASPGNGGKMHKSESDGEIESLRKRIEEQDKALAEQNKALLQLAEVVATPIRKSVKGVSDLKFIERTEQSKAPAAATLSKSEVNDKLKKHIRGGKLSDSDKELIAKFTVGAVDVTKIEHLLADAK